MRNDRMRQPMKVQNVMGMERFIVPLSSQAGVQKMLILQWLDRDLIQTVDVLSAISLPKPS